MTSGGVGGPTAEPLPRLPAGTGPGAPQLLSILFTEGGSGARRENKGLHLVPDKQRPSGQGMGDRQGAQGPAGSSGVVGRASPGQAWLQIGELRPAGRQQRPGIPANLQALPGPCESHLDLGDRSGRLLRGRGRKRSWAGKVGSVAVAGTLAGHPLTGCLAKGPGYRRVPGQVWEGCGEGAILSPGPEPPVCLHGLGVGGSRAGGWGGLGPSPTSMRNASFPLPGAQNVHCAHSLATSPCHPPTAPAPHGRAFLGRACASVGQPC